ncbi:MAG: hypothetical protein M1829_002344 [Trizodia sp. TS-e1964]|nr:MAG: hypothetical protein M1829_002344 [Trizodia sp. TS-e1964]
MASKDLLQYSTESPDISSDVTVSYRKLWKDEAKRSRVAKKQDRLKRDANPSNGKWELTVGIEIHAQLNTDRKLFSSKLRMKSVRSFKKLTNIDAATSMGATPNSNVAPFDLALPGSQPIFQKEALIPALRAALALNCNIQHKSKFDRKHYFHWDQPAGYQITQFYEPFAKAGQIILYDHDGIAPEDGEQVTIGIKQIQMEQDTAKTVHYPPSTHALDFNRVSYPLIEIITLPEIHHPSTAAACVRKIQAILKSVNAAVIGMELGGLRADVNVSVRPYDLLKENHSTGNLGQRTEIKNLSSLKAVEDAIIAERDRQIAILEAGGIVKGETRGWTIGGTQTRKLRSKEGEVDYRYMPDPDLGSIIIDKGLIDHLRTNLPALPDEILQDLIDKDTYDVLRKDAKTLMALDDGERLIYYEEVVGYLQTELKDIKTSIRLGRIASNWVLHELGGLLSSSRLSWNDNPLSARSLGDILIPLVSKEITGSTAKQLLLYVLTGDNRPIGQIIKDEGLALRPLSSEEYRELAQAVLDENPSLVKQIQKKGQAGKINWFVGQLMQRGGEGRVEAEQAEAVLRDILGISIK